MAMREVGPLPHDWDGFCPKCGCGADLIAGKIWCDCEPDGPRKEEMISREMQIRLERVFSVAIGADEDVIQEFQRWMISEKISARRGVHAGPEHFYGIFDLKHQTKLRAWLRKRFGRGFFRE